MSLIIYDSLHMRHCDYDDMIFILRNLLFFISLNKMKVLMNLYSKETHLIFRGEANLFFRFWPDSRSEM